MITDGASLKAGIASWLDVNASDISTVISDLVVVGERRLFREVRTRDMEASFTGTISSGVIAVPTDFLEWKHAYVDGSPTQRLESRPVSWIYERYPTRSAESKPQFIARDASNFIFGPYPDSGYTVKGTYFKKLDSANSSTSNAIVSSMPDLYLMACLAESEALIGRDKRIVVWESKYRTIRDSVNEEYSKNQFGGALAVRVA